MSGPTVKELREASPSALRRFMADGHAIVPEALEERAYMGISLGLPHWIERLGWTTFVKTFHRDPHSGALRGWNVRVEQQGLEPPVTYRRTPQGQPTTWGFFEVVDGRDHSAPGDLEHGLLIHYGLGGQSPLNPVSRIRDPLVSLSADDTSRLLGVTYLKLGWNVMTPSYFLLQCPQPLDHIAHA